MLTKALSAEARDRWSADYCKVKAKVEEAVLPFRDYPHHTETIAAMFALAAEIDRAVSDLNGRAPDGENRRLRGVELTARGMESGFTETTRTSPPPLNCEIGITWPARFGHSSVLTRSPSWQQASPCHTPVAHGPIRK